MQRDKNFHLINDKVCTRLKLHGEDVRNLLLNNKWKESDIGYADYILINTCAFLKRVEDKAFRRIISIAKKKKTDQRVVVFGCLPYINYERLKNNFGGEIITTRDTSEFVKKFNIEDYDSKVGYEIERKLNWISRLNKTLNMLFFKDPYFYYIYDKRKVFHLKISEGCLGNCAFCAEKQARGSLKSKMVADVIKEFRIGLSKGYKIFSLNADDTGVFGWDNDENVVMLLKRMLSISDDFQLAITEFNPRGLLRYKEELIKILKSPQIVLITVPIQSGSNKIIKSMRRPYKVKDVINTLDIIKKSNKDIKINTHLIVGFPGETMNDFSKSIEIVKNPSFNKVKIFEYSDRKSTDSYYFRNKLSSIEIKNRYKRIRRYLFMRLLRNFRIKDFLLNVSNFY